MTGELPNHLWQSTWFAAAAGLLTVAFRKNRAVVRYWLWFSASIKFFVPWALLMSLGSHLGWVPVSRKAATRIGTPVFSFAMEQLTLPFHGTLPAAPPAPGTPDWLPAAVLIVWAAGFAGVALIRLRGWLPIRSAVRSSTPVDIHASVEVRQSPGLLEPGVVGVLRPILLLPVGIADRLTPPQFEAVLTHELCHVRRRDNLFAAIHMAVEAAFWFHPMVWWIGARLVEERERACDEAVLRSGSEPHVYVEAILNVCRLYVESPLLCVSGVTGSSLQKRIEVIMMNRIALKLNFARKVVLAVAGLAALTVPIAMGIVNAPALRAQSMAAPAKFDSVWIQPCTDGYFPAGGGRGRPGNMQSLPFPPAAGAGAPSQFSEKVNVNCQNVMSLIQASYVLFANGRLDVNRSVPIEGAPAWVDSERYNINATASGAPGQDTMLGPMMQALLEARFGLRIHREIREVPVYALTVAAGGPKIQPFQPADCTPLDFTRLREAIQRGRYNGHAFEPLEPPGVNFCVNRGTGNGNNNLVEAQGMTLDDFCYVYLGRLDRPVVNQTGIAGWYDFHLEYATGETPSNVPAGPPIFTAIQEQLGLKLEPATAAREFLVVDRIEKPFGQ